MADVQTLPEMVRAKYPGQYDDLSDAELDAKVRAKFPGVYDDIAGPRSTTSEPNTNAGLAILASRQIIPAAQAVKQGITAALASPSAPRVIQRA